MANDKLKKNVIPISKINFDIIIVGGGVTGSFASILFTSLGYKVFVIDKSDLTQVKAGESLQPEIKTYLNKINFRISSKFAIDYFGNKSVWSEDKIVTNDYIYNPYGNGLSIDRLGFEKELRKQSSKAGTVFSLQTKIEKLEFVKNKWKAIIHKKVNISKVIQSNFLIIATGRNSLKGQFRQNKIYYDKLFSVSGLFENDFMENSNFLFTESLKSGWIYTNGIPSCKRIIYYFTDSDLINYSYSDLLLIEARSSKILSKHFHEKFSHNKMIINSFDARSYWNNNQGGKNWICLGDSAYSIDPLSGYGITKNFRMVDFVASNLAELVSCKKSYFEMYKEFNRNNFDSFMQSRVEQYSLVNPKIRQSTFWERRATTVNITSRLTKY